MLYTRGEEESEAYQGITNLNVNGLTFGREQCNWPEVLRLRSTYRLESPQTRKPDYIYPYLNTWPHFLLSFVGWKGSGRLGLYIIS